MWIILPIFFGSIPVIGFIIGVKRADKINRVVKGEYKNVDSN
jgi:hypothetical protein